MDPWKSPGPDGIPAAFFQKNWKKVKNDLIEGVLSNLNSGHLLKDINKSSIVLIPKRDDPTVMDHFRPISLCNVIYKIVSKCITNRIRKVIKELVGPSQNAFVTGRQIADNIILAHEVLENIRKFKGKKQVRVAIKTDMIKAYDRIRWDFLRAVLSKMGFPESFIGLIMQCVETVSYSIIFNGKQLEGFNTRCGLEQGYPLSPYLFILCMQALSGLIDNLNQKGFKGIKVAREAPPISHMLFEDDAAFFF